MKNKFITLIINGDGEGETALDYDFSSATRETIENGNKYPTLFRYCCADYYNIRALEKSQLFLCPIGDLNDVFEGLSSQSATIDRMDMRKLAYVKSFTENENSLLMWGVYADSFKGMCIEYDVNRLIGSDQESILYHLYPVAYTSERNNTFDMKRISNEYTKFMQALDNYGTFDTLVYTKDILPLFLTKSLEWQTENEWRIVVTAEHLFNEEGFDSGDPAHLKKMYEINLLEGNFIDFNCATRIYLGPKMEEQKKQHIKDIGIELSIPVIETRLSDKEYKLVEK